MMDSVGWGDSIQPGPDDDFEQFLNVCGMANLTTDGMQFDFQEFNSNGTQSMSAPQRQQSDIPMTGTDAPDLLSRADPVTFHQMSPMTTAPSYQAISASMLPPPTPTETIVDSIDAQIQFLQQQKLQHQQRQLEEQQAAFMVQQQSRFVPPTPQSLELQAGGSHFYSQASQNDHTPQQQPVDYRYHGVKEQQEVSCASFGLPSPRMLINCVRCRSPHWSHLQ